MFKAPNFGINVSLPLPEIALRLMEMEQDQKINLLN